MDPPSNHTAFEGVFTVCPGEYLNSIAIFSGYAPQAIEDANTDERCVGGTNVCGEHLDAGNFC